MNCAAPARTRKLPATRDLGTIDSELRLLAAVRRTAAELGGPLPSIGLLDERACPWRSSKLRQRERGNRLRLFGSNKHQRVINPLVQQLRINVGKHLGRTSSTGLPIPATTVVTIPLTGAEESAVYAVTSSSATVSYFFVS